LASKERGEKKGRKEEAQNKFKDGVAHGGKKNIDENNLQKKKVLLMTQ